jgi:serine/threonine-protein kinase
MKRISSAAQFKKADIYSFAKTLWILITKQKQGFEGQYVVKSSISIENFVDLKINDHFGTFGEWRYESLILLESLIKDSTDNNPLNRPSSLDFYSRLSDWYNTSSVLEKRNNYEWEHCLTRIFPISIPESSSWTNPKETHDILQLISKEYDQLNYSFLPEHGGIDIYKIDYAKEKDCLIINDYYIVNPKRLIFESMGNLDFSYFFLQLNDVHPLDRNNENQIREALFLNEDGGYSMSQAKVKNKVQRYLGGSFVITRKTSILNKIRGNFDGHLGIHDKKTPKEYRALVQRLVTISKNTDS